MAKGSRRDWSVPFAIALIVIGVWLLAERVLGPLWAPFAVLVSVLNRAAWPLALIALGVLLLVGIRRGHEGGETASRTLYRSREDRMIGGVLGGISEYLGLNATLVRVAFVIFALAVHGFPAAILYLVALILIPEEPIGGAPRPVVWPETTGRETVETPPPAPPTPPAPPVPPTPPAPPSNEPPVPPAR